MFESPSTCGNRSVNPNLDYIGNSKLRVKFDVSCFKQEKLTFTPETILQSIEYTNRVIMS